MSCRRAAEDVTSSQVAWDPPAAKPYWPVSMWPCSVRRPCTCKRPTATGWSWLARPHCATWCCRSTARGSRRALRGDTWLEDVVVLGRQTVRIYESPLWAKSGADTRILAGLLQVARPAEPMAGLARQALLMGGVVAVALALPLAY